VVDVLNNSTKNPKKKTATVSQWRFSVQMP